MKSALRIIDAVWDSVHAHVFDAPEEGFAFLLCRWHETSRGPTLIADDALLIGYEDVDVDHTGWSLSDRAIDRAINRAAATGKALVEVHTHPLGPPAFSRTDRLGLRPFAEFVLDSLPQRPYGATVWTPDGNYGEIFYRVAGQLRTHALRTTIVGNRLTIVDHSSGSAVARRFDRQVAWFGSAVQEVISGLRVGIVGVSGTGSHVVQGLALLGITDYVLVDPDVIGLENLNRMPIATPGGVGVDKVEAARGFILSHHKDAAVDSIVASVGESRNVEEALACVDVLFGCVDNDGPRLLLNRIAVQSSIPYLDVASGIYPVHDGYAAGGRVAITLPGQACLACTEELDLSEVRTYFMAPEEVARQVARGYVEGREVVSPSVVSLNGVIAHAALNEFLILLSRAREVALRIDLDLVGGGRIISGPYLQPRRNVLRRDGCVECGGVVLAA